MPERTDSELDRLVERGGFIDRDRAVEEPLTRGASAYTPADETAPDFEESPFTRAVDDQQAPADQDDRSCEEF